MSGIAVFAQKEVAATRINEAPEIDGKMNDACWEKLPISSDFTQIEPDAGKASTNKTEVRIGYDDVAIYVGAHCYSKPEDVSHVLSQRDNYNSNTDYFSIMLDTYNDQMNGFVFSVSTEGVQYDAKIYAQSYNSNLDMIWYSKVHHSDSGYTVEMKIPYSAIRFAEKDVQTWGVNFARYISLNREEATWNTIKPDIDNRVAQAGKLTGLRDIEPPVRLFFSPYISSYVEHFPIENDFKSDLNFDFNGGLDIKYGINEAFTLDMTLIPDFGQVVTDNVVLNLSPFEVFYDENRPFFNEGTELFEKTGHFYSRRVGGTPVNRSNVSEEIGEHERVITNPSNSPLLNATKVSGRNQNGLGIGVFNGISGEQYAVVEDTTSREKRQIRTAPFANYNVVVLDQNLKQNSSITFTNTNVWRSGDTYDANVTALSTNLNSKDNTYFVNGDAALSQQYERNGNQFGHQYKIQLGKQSGRTVYNINYREESDTYDPNDLGFLSNNNKRNVTGRIGYRIFQPFWKLNRISGSVSSTYSRLYNPNAFVGLNYNASMNLTNRKFHSAGFNFSGTMTERNDYFEPRTPGYFFKEPINYGGGFWISSNYQKPFALDVNANLRNFQSTPWQAFNYEISPRFRLGDHVFLVYSFRQNFDVHQRGYAIPFIGQQPSLEGPVFGERDVQTTTNTMDLRYTINNVSGITLRLRHYWSKVNYNRFFMLNNDGTLSPEQINETSANGEHKYNTNFNAFSIDMVYRWIFSPASELNLVWKNNIFTEDSQSSIAFSQNLDNTLRADQYNSISLRIVYFLDYLQIQQLLQKKKGADKNDSALQFKI